jgi:biopolymer transport protein ExbB/TolQ
MLHAIKAFALLGGEWVLAVIILLSLWALAIVWDRYFYFKERHVRAQELEKQLPALLAAGSAKEVAALCRKVDCPESGVVMATLDALSLGLECAGEAMEAQRIEERLEMDRHVLVLGTLGNNVPFIGLFGTVLGIIKAFNDLALAGTAGPSVVMNGVAEALVSTALGLLVAIPCVSAFNYFQDRVRRTMLNADRLSRLVLVNEKKLTRKKP